MKTPLQELIERLEEKIKICSSNNLEREAMGMIEAKAIATELLEKEREPIANILEWYDDLSPTDKCTVHGMVGTGLYAKTKKQLAEDYLRKHTVKSTLTQDKVREAAEKVCCDNQEMTDQRVEVSLNDKDGTYIDVNVDFCKNCGTCKDVWQYG